MSEMLAPRSDYTTQGRKQVSCGNIRPARLSTSLSSQHCWECMQIALEICKLVLQLHTAEMQEEEHKHTWRDTNQICLQKQKCLTTQETSRSAFKSFDTLKEKATVNWLQHNTSHYPYGTQAKSNMLHSYN